MPKEAAHAPAAATAAASQVEAGGESPKAASHAGPSATATAPAPARAAATAAVEGAASEGGASPDGGGSRLVVGAGGGAVPTTAPLKGEPVAYSQFGFPTIVRQVDGESGQARTIVQNEDGSHKVFGANTVSSLTGSSDGDAKRWLGALRDREMHGLVHELGKRLVGASQHYQQQRVRLEQLAHRGHYEYFGLQQGASEKEVQAAYRRMAKRMHPDKNGGTDEAKRKFQHMKERYECLKERFRPVGSTASTAASRDEPREDPESGEPEEAGGEQEDGAGGMGASGSGSSGSASGEEAEAAQDDTEDGRSPAGRSRRKRRSKDCGGRQRSQSSASTASPKRRGPDGTPGGGERRREAYDEDEDDDAQARRSGANSGGRIAYDPSDRGSLEETAWKMVEQMRQLQQGLDTVTAEIRRAGGA